MTAAPAGMRRAGRGAAMALAAGLLFAVNGTVSKLVLGSGLEAGRLMAVRVTGAALVLIVPLLLRRRASLWPSRRDVGTLVVYSLFGVSLVQWLYFVAIARLPVGIALLIEFTAPLMVALWVRFVRHEPVRSRIWVALALSLVGLALVAQVEPGSRLDPVGLLAASGAAVVLTFYLLMSERILVTRDAVSLATHGFVVSSVAWGLLNPWTTFPVALLAQPVALPGALEGSVVPVALLLVSVVVLGTVAPFLLTLWAIGHTGSTRVSLIGTSEPVLAGLIAWVVLGEALGAVQLAGVVVVLVGIVLAVTARAPAEVREDTLIASPLDGED